MAFDFLEDLDEYFCEKYANYDHICIPVSYTHLSFGEYRFFLPERIERGNVYLVGKEDKIYAGEDLSAYSVTYFENYYVIDAT